jgi:predicted MFS family arabinose efflux permease
MDIKEGLVWLWHHPLIRFIAFLTGCVNLLITSSVVLIVIVVAQHLHASSFTIGMLLSIGGAGGIIGALIGPVIQKRWRFGQVMIAIACLRAILWPLIAVVPNLAVLALVIAIFSPLGPIYDVVQFSYRMALIPDVLQGRVNSVFRLIAFGGQPLGLALAGLLLQTIQAVPTILIIGGCLVLLAVSTISNPHVRSAP